MKYQDCINACNACAESCAFCARAGLRGEDAGALEKRIRSAHECATICSIASKFMLLGEGHVREICGVCADRCDEFAEECEKFLQLDCYQKCAQACRRCAEECRKIGK